MANKECEMDDGFFISLFYILFITNANSNINNKKHSPADEVMMLLLLLLFIISIIIITTYYLLLKNIAAACVWQKSSSISLPFLLPHRQGNFFWVDVDWPTCSCRHAEEQH